MEKDIMEEFPNPGNEYRSTPFWAWDDHLHKEELTWQIEQMHQVGIGGFFMHSREGLETPYLGQEWDECVLACVAEAKKLGMGAWLYDEDRWPSGSCGGKVQQAVGALKGLTLEVVEDFPALRNDSKVLALYGARIEGDDIFSLRRFEGSEELEKGETLLVVRLEESAPSPWFNDNPPPDNLDERSVGKFLELTHEHYYKLCKDDFSKVVKGSFTDEPSLCDRHASFDPHRGWIPWTTGLGKWMEQRLGYDILDTIPYLYFNGDKSSRTRHDYWHMIALRYEACYSRQIGQWCRSHGIAYTGHFLQEDKLGLCARVNGSIMPHYTHQGICGIDMLCERTDEYMTVKQCSSVASQYGIKEVLTETYAATGWGFTFEGQKWVGDWQYVLGVNHRCQHLMLYSLRGCRKRDYPPCFNYNTSWWSQYGMVEDYFARLAVILRRGKAMRDILVIHPMSTVWSHLGCSPYGNPVRRNERDVKKLDAYGYLLNDLIKELCSLHLDCDLGDETILERVGSVEDGRFVVNQCRYSIVVVPQVDTLFGTTLALLRRFKDKGGTIIIQSPLPTMVEGREDPSIGVFFSSCVVVANRKQLCSEVEKVKRREVSLREMGSECKSILCQVREDGGNRYLFLVNNDRDHSHSLELETSFVGSLTNLDATSGAIKLVTVDTVTSSAMCWHETIGPCDSRLYQINLAEKPTLQTRSPLALQEELSLIGEWEGKLDYPNALTLDTCSWSLEDAGFSPMEEVWRAQREVRDLLGMRALNTDEIAQRYKWIGVAHPNDGRKLQLKFTFSAKETIPSPVSLAVEDAQLFEIFLDGTRVDAPVSGYYLDKSFKVLPLPPIRKGEHTIVLETKYLNSMELEAIYLIGSFAVGEDRKVSLLKPRFTVGDWTRQGLFHYPGSLTYSKSFTLEKDSGRLLLDIGSFLGTCVVVFVNGTRYPIPWKARKCIDITDSYRQGENQLDIQVFGSPRNLLGPFHLKGGEPENCNCSCFMPGQEDSTSEYHVEPYGLLSPVRLLRMS